MTRPDTEPTRLAAALTACDSMRTIERTLTSLAGLADRVVVVDSGSRDGTVDACRAHGAEVIHRPWSGHVAQKQFAIDLCADATWVLLLDSDESLEPTLRDTVRDAITRNDPRIDGFEINRKLHYAGAWLHRAFQPEWRLRLVRGGRATVHGLPPHDRLEVPGNVRRIAGDLRHDSFSDLEDMLRRQLGYARISAEQGARGGSIGHLLVSPAAAFIKQMILKRGILDGWRGIVCGGGAAAATLMKHLFIMERSGARSRQDTRDHGGAE